MEFKLELPIALKEFLKYPKAKLLKSNNLEYRISKVATDTRTFKGKGGIFFALKGKFFDAHKFIDKIINQIDYVVISDKNYIINNFKEKFIIVDDTTLAFDYLASIYRGLFKKLKVISVVGSNGKTTTKELIKSVLSKKYSVVASKENQNNLIGVAYTLFSLKKDTEFCIVELGISLPGEMDILAKTVKPNYVVITNIGKEHLEFLKNLNTVFKEETKILRYLNKDGIAILNRDDIFLKKIKEVNTKWYGIKDTFADVCAKDIYYSPTSTTFTAMIKENFSYKNFKIKTKLLGEYNVYNTLAAITTALICKVEIPKIIASLSSFEPVSMRGERFKINNNLIINESYNANPDSMRNSITQFCNIFFNKDKVLILGDMLELGKCSLDEHKRLKDYIDIDKLKYLFLVGKEIKILYDELNKKEKIFYYEEVNETLKREISKLIENNKNLAILIKSSHAVGLWKVAEEIKTRRKK